MFPHPYPTDTWKSLKRCILIFFITTYTFSPKVPPDAENEQNKEEEEEEKSEQTLRN